MSTTSSVNEYLLLSRGRWDAARSPGEIQAAIDAFYAWLVAEGRFKPGQRLAKAAKLVTRSDNPCLACGLAFEIRPIEPEQASAWRESNETPPDAGWLP